MIYVQEWRPEQTLCFISTPQKCANKFHFNHKCPFPLTHNGQICNCAPQAKLFLHCTPGNRSSANCNWSDQALQYQVVARSVMHRKWERPPGNWVKHLINISLPYILPFLFIIYHFFLYFIISSYILPFLFIIYHFWFLFIFYHFFLYFTISFCILPFPPCNWVKQVINICFPYDLYFTFCFSPSNHFQAITIMWATIWLTQFHSILALLCRKMIVSIIALMVGVINW